jgi:mono/diheme cytochrome c family protein
MFRYLAVAMIAYAGTAIAAPDVLSFGDPAQGKALYQQKCAACHASQFGGDGSSIFTRPNRRIHTPAALLAQVQACNQRTHADLTAEDEQSVAAWLNQRYYKFK